MRRPLVILGLGTLLVLGSGGALGLRHLAPAAAQTGMGAPSGEPLLRRPWASSPAGAALPPAVETTPLAPAAAAPSPPAIRRAGEGGAGFSCGLEAGARRCRAGG
ncbi:hypothetical protein [Rubellimicrobium sp. CFH 75288]|uniref:hypothetical protein n=1 Tax=Rubellimicrobium sp. CFH 75288 TaxID=2697034 RepID=UPI0014134FCB|nr:hypothetical protein [Rubellimicrobium sp. CFH 75288]NAZ35953.1 hypothetical protein [Rubellimicrobium sp. CFH 75288]